MLLQNHTTDANFLSHVFTHRFCYRTKIKKLEEKLKSIRHKHFNARNTQEKSKLREKDRKTRNELLELFKEQLKIEIESTISNDKRSLELDYYKEMVEQNGKKKKYLDEIERLETELNVIRDSYQFVNNKASVQLASWNSYDQNHFASFFDSEWMFGLIDGFDVVIGNPPYVQIQKFSGKQEQKDWANEKYKTFVKTGDIYTLFYERGNMLLKKSGVLAFITSNKWLRSNYGKATRKYFVENTVPLTLIDFGGYRVFESATVDTNILIFEKATEKQNNRAVLACTVEKDFTDSTDIVKYIEENGIYLDDISESSWIISNKEEAIIKRRIEEIGTPLSEWDVSINFGIKTGFNEAFVISGSKKDELIAKDAKSADIIKPILRGRDIKRYKVDFANLWLINSHNGFFDNDTQKKIPSINIDDYPAIREHLNSYWTQIEKRQDQGDTPYNLRSCAYLNEIEKDKIVYPDIMRLPRNASSFENFPYFYLDNRHNYVEATNFFISGEGLHIIIAILSSRLGIYSFEKFYSGPKFDAKGFRFKKDYLQKFPIPKLSEEKQLPFKILVDCVLFAKEKEMTQEASYFESVIDAMVYDLYFADVVKSAGCEVFSHLQNLPVMNDDWNDEKKKKIIEKVFKELSNPAHPVFIAMEKQKTVPEVRIIEGLNK